MCIKSYSQMCRSQIFRWAVGVWIMYTKSCQTCSLDPFWDTNCPALSPDLIATNFSCRMCQRVSFTRHTLPPSRIWEWDSGQAMRYSRQQYLASGAVSCGAVYYRMRKSPYHFMMMTIAFNECGSVTVANTRLTAISHL